MAISAHVTMAGNPEFELRVRSGPLAFEVEGDGTIDARTSEIRAGIEEIPVSVRIPFLRRHHGRVVVASIGPFGIKLEPFEAQLRAVGARIAGVAGPEGIDCGIEGKVGCRMEIDITGKLPGKVVKAAIEGAFEDRGE